MRLANSLKPLAAAGALCLLAACGNKDEPEPADAAAPDAAADAPAATAEAAPEAAPDTADKKLSYAMGFQLANSFANDPVLQLDEELMIRGIRDALAGKEMAVSMADAQAASEELQGRLDAHQSAAAEQASAAGKAFLETNKAKPGIVTTASGLQYESLQEGEGSDQSPTPQDTVTVHYHGTLTDGTVFDSSVDRGSPATFPLGGVIAGWTEGLQRMTVGDKYRFYIPSELAYGARPMGSIPPHSVLIFDVELLAIGE